MGIIVALPSTIDWITSTAESSQIDVFDIKGGVYANTNITTDCTFARSGSSGSGITVGESTGLIYASASSIPIIETAFITCYNSGSIVDYVCINILPKFSTEYYQKILSIFGSSLVAYWPLWETSGSVAYDISENLKDLSLNGDISYRQLGKNEFTAMGFDGSSAYATRDATDDNIEFGPQEMINGSFETYIGTVDDGVNDSWAGWTNVNNATSYVEATAVSQEGIAAIKLKLGTASAGIYQQITNIIPEAIYALVFWSRGDGTYSGRYTIHDDTNNVDIKGISTVRITEATYTRKYYVFTAPAGCTTVKITFWASSDASADYVYFDNVSLRQLKPFIVSYFINRTDEVAVERQYIINRMLDVDKRMWATRFWGIGEDDDVSAGKMVFSMTRDGTNTTRNIQSTTILQPGIWYHVIAVYQPIAAETSILSIYIDGIKEAEITTGWAPIFDSDAPLRIASTAVIASEHYFHGLIQHVAIASGITISNEQAQQLAII
jgi:hypothetical protein